MEDDGRHDFDFLFGRWTVHNRKLVDQFDADCDEWEEFEATAEARPILAGYGNIDVGTAQLPGGRAFEGMSLRLFDPESRLWRIWWSSTSRPGHLDAPVVGGFRDGRGEFVGDDEYADRRYRMRFRWSDITDTAARWAQEFSFDGGRTWGRENWVMTLRRAAAL